MIKTSSFSSRLLLRYFSIFLFAIIFSTTSIGLSYYITIKSLETNLVKNNQSTAIQMKDIVEERLIKIAYSINYLGSSYRTNYLLNLKVPLDKSEPMDMICTQQL